MWPRHCMLCSCRFAHNIVTLTLERTGVVDAVHRRTSSHLPLGLRRRRTDRNGILRKHVGWRIIFEDKHPNISCFTKRCFASHSSSKRQAVGKVIPTMNGQDLVMFWAIVLSRPQPGANTYMMIFEDSQACLDCRDCCKASCWSLCFEASSLVWPSGCPPPMCPWWTWRAA